MAREAMPEPLTARERQIADAYANGSSYKQIAGRLFIAPTTVRTHLSAIYRKLGVSSKIELLRVLQQLEGEAQREPSAVAQLTQFEERTPHDSVDHTSKNQRQERRQVVLLLVSLDLTHADGRATDIELIQDYFSDFSHRAEALIVGAEGTLIHRVGERLVACLGWPIAHEDDAARAVRTALAIREITQESPEDRKSVTPQCRIVLAMGTIIASRTSTHHSETDVFLGDALNVAEKILVTASPGQVLIDEAIANRTIGTFEIRAESKSIKSSPGTDAKVYAVEKELPAASRFEARMGTRLTRIIGRDEELTFLHKRWRTAKAGEGQAVLVTGEAGIGKSRLIRAMLDSTGNGPTKLLRYQCSQNHRDSALWPVIIRFLADSEIATEQPLDLKDSELRRVLEEAGPSSVADFPLISALIGIENSDAEKMVANLPPKVRRARTMDALNRYVIGLTKRTPIVLVFEDIHWADPSTYEWMVQLIEAISDHRALVLLSSRPALFQRLSELPNLAQLSLSRLDRQGALAMVAEIAATSQVAEDVRKAIVDRGDGIPLFIEELTKSVLELRLEAQADQSTAKAADALNLVIPSTLQELIQARIDRLDTAKEVLEVAACIGRQFSYTLLAASADLPQAKLHSTLEQLTASGMVFQRGTLPDAHFLFRHALIRDAVYVGLLRREREKIHKRIATVLEDYSKRPINDRATSLMQSTPAENDPGQIAYHYSEARIWDKAFEFFSAKGYRAYAEYANIEASDAFASALTALKSMDPSKKNTQATIEISILLGSIHTFTGNIARGLELYSAALRKAEELEDRRLLIHSLSKIGRAYYDIGEYDRCDQSYSSALELAVSDLDHGRTASIYNGLGLLRLTVSTLPEAILLFEKSLKLQSELGNRSGEASACISLALAWNRVGDSKKAKSYAERSLGYSRANDDKRQLLWSLIAMANANAISGNKDKFAHFMEMAERHFREISHYQATTWLVWVRSLIAIDSIDDKNGFEIAQKGVQIVEHGGFFAHETAATYARSAALFLIAGHSELAWQYAREAVEWAKHGPIRLELGVASIVLMQLHSKGRARSDKDMARKYFQDAVENFTAVGAELDLGRAYLVAAEVFRLDDPSDARLYAENARTIFNQFDSAILLARAESLVSDLQ